MKGEAMQNIDKKETTSTPRRRMMWIGLGAAVRSRTSARTTSNAASEMGRIDWHDVPLPAGCR